MLPSYEEIIRKLNLYKFNFVMHVSELPTCKGCSSLTRQILEGKDKILIILNEATVFFNAGSIYVHEWFELEDSELAVKLRET